MKVMIDTNIILDAMLKRHPFDGNAYQILKYADKKMIEAYISSSAVTDIYYIIRKKLNHSEALTAFKALFNIVEIVSVTKKDIEKSMSYENFTDLEDALQVQCMKKVKADYIVTRDEELLKIEKKAIHPGELLNVIESK